MQLVEFAPLTPSQLKDQAYAIIKRAITSLQFPPGASIVESQLAQRLGISKTPVRMALVRLEHEGFVETRRASGTFVSRMTFGDVAEIFEVRRALELCALERVCGAGSERGIRDLRTRIACADELVRQGDEEAAFDAINEFHLLLVDLAGNQRLSQTYRTLYDHVVRIGNVCGRIPGRNAASQDQHTAVVDGLAACDVDAARRALVAHIDEVLDDYRQSALSNHLLEGSGPQR